VLCDNVSFGFATTRFRSAGGLRGVQNQRPQKKKKSKRKDALRDGPKDPRLALHNELLAWQPKPMPCVRWESTILDPEIIWSAACRASE